jgi:large subunit ribosomal protein L30
VSDLRITLVRSVIGSTKEQRRTVQTLGLRRVRQTVQRPDNPSVRGMLRSVAHLVRVEEAGAQPSHGRDRA